MIMLHGKEKKYRVVEDFSRLLSENLSVLIVKNDGLSAKASSVLRDLIFMKNLGGMLNVKNKIMHIVLQKAGFDNVYDLRGAHYVFYSHDIIALMKFLDYFLKGDCVKEKLIFLFGYDERKVCLGSEELRSMMAMPSKEVIFGKIALSLRYSMMRVAGIKCALMRSAFCMKNFGK